MRVPGAPGAGSGDTGWMMQTLLTGSSVLGPVRPALGPVEPQAPAARLDRGLGSCVSCELPVTLPSL